MTTKKTRWTVRTNQHPNCDGTPWGWIEGSDITWSNESRSKLTRADAQRLAAEHNAAIDREPEA